MTEVSYGHRPVEGLQVGHPLRVFGRSAGAAAKS
jgi:hypothetical protein